MRGAGRNPRSSIRVVPTTLHDSPLLIHWSHETPRSGNEYVPGIAFGHPVRSWWELQFTWSSAEEQQRRQNRSAAGSTLRDVVQGNAGVAAPVTMYPSTLVRTKPYHST